MSAPAIAAGAPPRRLGRSAGAVLLGLAAVIVLSLGTDQVLHVLHVYPPWGQPMWDPRLNALALAYRLVYGTLGGYLMARAAPYAPMRHAMTGGAIGFLLSALGAAAAIDMQMGPAWYPIALALSALPTSWAGATIAIARGEAAVSEL